MCIKQIGKRFSLIFVSRFSVIVLSPTLRLIYPRCLSTSTSLFLYLTLTLYCRFTYPRWPANCTDDEEYIKNHPNCTHLMWPKHLDRQKHFKFDILPYYQQKVRCTHLTHKHLYMIILPCTSFEPHNMNKTYQVNINESHHVFARVSKQRKHIPIPMHTVTVIRYICSDLHHFISHDMWYYWPDISR